MKVVVVLDALDPERLAAFWTHAMGYRRSSAEGPYVVLVPLDGIGPELVLQRVRERKVVKNRMHLDLRVQDLAAEVARLESLGATRASREPIEEAGVRWIVMADPEGNEFCVGVEAARNGPAR